MRRIPRLLGLLLMALIVGCGRSAPPAPALPPPEPPPTESESDTAPELVIWAEYWTVDAMNSDPEGRGRYGRYLVEQFEAEHPGVTVRLEFHGWDEGLRQNLSNALLAGTPPDVVVGENFFRPLIHAGELLPLDPLLETVREELLPGTYEAVAHEGQIYGLPAFTGVFGFERNCEVITAAGLDCDHPPATWTELLAQSRIITERGEDAYYGYTLQGPAETYLGSALRIAVFLAQADAELCLDDCSRPYFDNPRALPVLEFLRELHRTTPPGLAFNPDEGQIYEQLFRGLTAYQIAGSWHPQWARETGCADCRYSAVPIPEGGHEASLVVGNVIYVVLAQSEQPDLALEWVRFLVRDDVQALVYPTLGRLPTTRTALETLRPSVEPEMQPFIDQLLYNPHLTVLPQWRREPQELWRIYNEMVIQVLTTERPIMELMNEAQLAAEGILEP